MRRLLTVRTLALAGAAGCLLSLAIAYFFMERYLLLEPCPLCILDRFVVAFLGIGFLAFAAADPKAKGVRLAFIAINAAILGVGFVVAGRHIYLQNRPLDEMPLNCLSDSEAARGLVELIERSFDANADCGIIIWEFLGLSIPEQVLLLFLGFAALLALQSYLAVREDAARQHDL